MIYLIDTVYLFINLFKVGLNIHDIKMTNLATPTN